MDIPTKIRIIGGKWRGRKLSVIKSPGLRPTPDRVRETLFNWVNKKITNARCLDLFSGTGALSFEALSRGASEVTMVESNPNVVKNLTKTADILESKLLNINCVDAISWLKEQTKSYDIIFLDPPFGYGYVEKCCQIIYEQSLLDNSGIIYIESEKDIDIPSVFKVKKITYTKQVQSVLVELNKEN